MEWDAGRRVLRCPYCGFIPKDQPNAEPDAAGVVELDLAKALAEVGDEGRGYGTATISVKCQNCQAISVFEPGRVAQRCDFCGSPAVVPYTETKDPITPQSVLPVHLDEHAVRDAIKRWLGRRWLAPNRLKTGALTDVLHGVYLPYWTFDAQADARWTAESGDYYYVTEYVTGPDGKRQARQVQKVRWYPSSGQLQHFFDDDLVPGTAGVRPDLLRAVEPFPTKQLVPYDPAYVRGWTVERYQLDLRQAAVASQGQMEQAIYALCARQVPGDTHRNLNVQSQFAARTFKHVLVPVWLVTYRYGTRTYQTIVNGYTGAVAGDAPTSWVKVTVLVIAALAVAGVLLYATGGW